MNMYQENMVHKYLLSNLKMKNKRRNPQTRGQITEICDNIITFDIETTSGYINPNGDFEIYDYKKDESYYRDCEKIGFMYIWQMGIDDFVFYGRTWESFKSALSEFPENVKFIIYVHNLGFEFQFLRNVLEFSRVFARKPRKPLTAEYKNFQFRDSYSLVNLSLSKWAEQKDLPVKKLTGDLDYNKLRTPYTPLYDDELKYCENDILVMYHGLKEYREKYGAIYKIPLTQTSEVRQEIQKNVLSTQYSWRIKQAKLIPRSLDEYNNLMLAYFGGDTHANYKHADKVITGVTSGDFASSYPYVMLSEKFPAGKFKKINGVSCMKKFMRNPKYSYLITFEMVNIKSKLYNTFLSRSRCTDVLLFKDENGKYLPDQIDNGRIIKALYIKATFTNIDFEMLCDFYEYAELKILDFRVTTNAYLNGELRRYILKLYNNKTKLKNIDGYEDLYKKSKQYINSLYGMAVTRDFTDEVIFNDEWDVLPTTQNSFNDAYDKKIKRLDKIILAPQVGIWVTAYARQNLWRGMIAPLDEKVVYFDTDSCKFIGTNLTVFKKYNAGVQRKYKKLAEDLGVNVEDFEPTDTKGNKQKIGQIDLEYTATKFKTLGAKKYIYEVDGKIKMVVSGVPKKPENIPTRVEDFNIDLKFTPEKCGKLISHYTEEQPSIIFDDGFIMDQKYGVCLQPTGYTLGITLDYATLLLNNREPYNHDFDKMIKG